MDRGGVDPTVSPPGSEWLRHCALPDHLGKTNGARLGAGVAMFLSVN